MQPFTVDIDKILGGDVHHLQALLEAAAASEPGPGPGFETLDALDRLLPHLSQVEPPTPGGGDEAMLATRIEQTLRSRNITLAPVLKVRLMLADRLFSGMLSLVRLESPLNVIVLSLRQPFVGAALSDDSFYCQDDNPVRELAENILTHSLTWYPLKGKIGQAYAHKLEDSLAALAALAPGDRKRLDACRRDFCRYVDRETERARDIETRTCQTEIGAAKIAAAEQSVTGLINARLAGRRLPASVAEFIQTTWKNELQFLLINHGPQAELWARWQSILESLASVFAQHRDEAARQQLYTEIPQLLERLEMLTPPATCTQEEYQEFVDELGESLMRLLKDEEVECINVEALEMPGEVAGIKTVVSRSLARQGRSLAVGEWFVLTLSYGHNEAGAETIRCKLAAKIPETDQLLFVNRHGHKVMQKSLNDFILCLSSRIASPLSLASPFAPALREALVQLDARYQNNLDRARREQNRRARITAQFEMKKKEKLQAQAEARQAAALKAKHEADALAAEKALREQQRREALLRQQQRALEEADRRRACAASALEQLQIGAWLEVPDPLGALTRCKLAVNIPSSGKYIFVDRIGIKVAEYPRETLIEMLAADTARILNQGEKFEDQLAKIVKGLRRGLF